MRITGKCEADGTSGAALDNTQTKPRKPFSDVLREEKQRPTETRKKSAREPATNGGAAQGTAVGAARTSFGEVGAVDGGQGAGAEREALLTSLVQEITVEAPPGADASVNIQFDSRTLEGLHVQVQKTDGGLEVRFTSSSEAVTRLLAVNAPQLAEGLVQRGYVAPSISVQRTPGARSGRDRGGKHGQARDQKRR